MRPSLGIALAAFAAMGGGIGGYSRWVEPLPERPAQAPESQAATMTAAEAKRARKKAARLKAGAR